jgi:hypothetical protein
MIFIISTLLVALDHLSVFPNFNSIAAQAAALFCLPGYLSIWTAYPSRDGNRVRSELALNGFLLNTLAFTSFSFFVFIWLMFAKSVTQTDLSVFLFGTILSGLNFWQFLLDFDQLNGAIKIQQQENILAHWIFVGFLIFSTAMAAFSNLLCLLVSATFIGIAANIFAQLFDLKQITNRIELIQRLREFSCISTLLIIASSAQAQSSLAIDIFLFSVLSISVLTSESCRENYKTQTYFVSMLTQLLLLLLSIPNVFFILSNKYEPQNSELVLIIIMLMATPAITWATVRLVKSRDGNDLHKPLRYSFPLFITALVTIGLVGSGHMMGHQVSHHDTTSEIKRKQIFNKLNNSGRVILIRNIQSLTSSNFVISLDFKLYNFHPGISMISTRRGPQGFNISTNGTGQVVFYRDGDQLKSKINSIDLNHWHNIKYFIAEGKVVGFLDNKLIGEMPLHFPLKSSFLLVGDLDERLKIKPGFSESFDGEIANLIIGSLKASLRSDWLVGDLYQMARDTELRLFDKDQITLDGHANQNSTFWYQILNF